MSVAGGRRHLPAQPLGHPTRRSRQIPRRRRRRRDRGRPRQPQTHLRTLMSPQSWRRAVSRARTAQASRHARMAAASLPGYRKATGPSRGGADRRGATPWLRCVARKSWDAQRGRLYKVERLPPSSISGRGVPTCLLRDAAYPRVCPRDAAYPRARGAGRPAAVPGCGRSRATASVMEIPMLVARHRRRRVRFSSGRAGAARVRGDAGAGCRAA